MLSHIQKQRGVTLIELLIGIVILGILVGLAVPSFQDWMKNAQIRNAADATLNGLQLARTEAIARNALVQFRFNNTTYGWQVWNFNGKVEIRAWSPQQGARNTMITSNSNTSKVTFDGLGRRVANPVEAPATTPEATLTQLEVTVATGATAATRNLRITISDAGSVRMCDPNVSNTTGDPRAC